jgi:hypothetical protein
MSDIQQLVEQLGRAEADEKLRTAQFIEDHRKQMAVDGQRMAASVAALRQREERDRQVYAERVKAARDKAEAAEAELKRSSVHEERLRLDLDRAMRLANRNTITALTRQYADAKQATAAAKIAWDEAAAARVGAENF